MKNLITLFILSFFSHFLLANNCATAVSVSFNTSWQPLTDDQFDGQQSWYAFTPLQNGTVQLCRAASFIIYDNCLNGGPSAPLSTTTTATTCSVGINAPLEELQVFAGNTIYIIVQAGFAGATVYARFVAGNTSPDCGSTCYENPELTGGQVTQCDNFESYTSDQFISPQSPFWTKWSTGSDDADVRTYFNVAEQYLRVERSGSIDPDVVYNLGNRTSGRYRLSWELNVAAGRSAYYNLLHTLPDGSGGNANLAFQAIFNSDGSALLDKPGANTNFSYNNGAWNRIMQIIDLDENLIEFWVNDDFIDSWTFSDDISATPGANRLAGINFYAYEGLNNDAPNLYAIDNICLWEVQGCACPQVYDPVCVKNGVEYGNSCAARCGGGYITAEWIAGPCNPTASNCDQATPIQCGQTLSNQTTANQGDNFNGADYANCQSTGHAFNGPDKVYEINITQRQQVKIFLDILNANDLDIFLLDQCSDPQQVGVTSVTNCIAASYVDNNSVGVYKEAIDIILDPGTYYIVVDGKNSNNQGPFNLFISCDCSCSEPPNDPPGGTVTLCENFGDYDLAAITPQSTRWRPWSNGSGDGAVITQNDNQQLKIEDNGNTASDILYLLDGLNSGRYRLSWRMWVESGKGGYFATMHQAPNSSGSNDNSANEVFFYEDGSGRLSLVSDNIDFTYLNGNWNDVMQIIDIDQNVAELWINHIFIASWNFNQGFSGSSSQLDAINFWASDNNNSFRVDDICLRQVGLDCGFISCAGQEPVCGQNGMQYTCEGRARCEGYISSEFERCFSICDYGGTFVYRTDLFTDTMRITDLAPPLLRQESCILNSYGGAVPGNFYADIYIFYNDNSDDINVNDQVMGDNTKFFVFSCDCSGATCTQTCLGEVGNGFSGSGLPEGFYYIVATNTAPEPYGFAVFPNGNCNFGVTPLNCGDTVTDSLNTNSSAFDTGGANGFDAYDDCYNGARNYLGGERVYRITLDTPSLVSVGLESDEPMGVFLYNYLCARNCMAYAETGPQGGLATLDSLPLLDGVYYLVVDREDSPAGNASYTLSMNCPQNNNFFISTFNNITDFVENCPPDPASTHLVKIPETAFPFTQQHRLSFLTLDNTLPRVIEGMSLFWNGATEMDFEIPKDLTGDAFKCAYLEGDEILLYLTDLSGSNFNGSLCQLEFQSADTGDVTAEGLFTPNATSRINRMTRLEVDNARLSSIYETVPAAGDIISIELLIDDQDWSITEVPPADWLSVDPVSGRNSAAIDINVAPNPSPLPRSTVLQFRFEGSVVTYQYLFVEQRGLCITPVASITADVAGNQICAGESATLTAQVAPIAAGLYTYQWSSGETTPSIPINPASSQPYAVTVSEDNCFSTAIASIDIAVIASPPPPASQGDRVFCDGEAIPALQVSSTVEVRWYDQPQGGNLVGAGASFTPPAEGTYYAEAVAGAGCSSESRTAATLTRRPAPTANAGPDVSVCAGQPATLNASASGGSGSGYTFTWSGGLPAIQNPTASPANTTTYSLTATDSNGCSDTDEVQVAVNELPTVSVSPTAATCGLANGSATASASGGQGPYTFSWSNGQTGPEATGLFSGSISVTVTDSLGCMAASSATVSNTGGPSIFPIDGQEICAGESASLATGATGGTEPYTFTWDQGLPNGPAQTVSPDNTTTYQAIVTDANNCSETTQVTVVVNPLPSADAGEDSEICRGNEYVLQASASGGSGEYTFHWNNGLGFGPEKLVSPLTSTTYMVSITDDKGCSDTDQVSIGVNPLPAVSITKTDAACGQNTGSAVADASGGAGPYSFLWSNGQTDEMADNLAAGSYAVTVTDNNGCATTGTIAVSDQAGPIVDIPGVSQICRGDSVNLIAVVLDGNGPYNYDWAGGLGANMNVRVAPPATTTYSVTVSDVNDCIGVAQVTVPVAQRATVNAGPNQSVCAGTEIQLNGQIGGGAVSGTWDALISGGSFNPGPAALDAAFTPPANYTGPITFALMATATAPCPSVLSYMAVDIKPLPTLDISGILCEPGYETYGFEAQSNVNDVTFSGGTATPAGAGVFIVSAIQAGLDVTATAINPVTGCESVAEITAPDCDCQDVVSEPPVSLGDVTVCANEPFPPLEVAVGDGEAATWYATQTGGDPLAENTTSFVPATPGTYYAARVNIPTLCESTARVAVMLSTKPLPTADAGNNQTICPGEEALLQAQEEAGYTYLWSNGAATPSTLVSPQTTQTFTLTVTADGCSAEDMVTITVNPAIQGDIVLLNRLDCFGDTDGSLLIDASGGVPPLAYAWPNGSALAAVSGLSAGAYTVTITDQAGCNTTETFELMEPPALTEASSSVTPDTNGIHTGAINIGIDGGTPPYTYNWTGGGGFQSSQQNPSGLAAGNYFLTVRDSRQCALQLGPFTVPIVVGLEESVKKQASVQLFPNPTNGKVWISVALPQLGDVQLEAFNPLGERILQLKWKDITERATELDFSGYPSGIYLIKLAHEKGFIAKRLVVQQN